jgi:hypothetical protein
VRQRGGACAGRAAMSRELAWRTPRASSLLTIFYGRHRHHSSAYSRSLEVHMGVTLRTKRDGFFGHMRFTRGALVGLAFAIGACGGAGDGEEAKSPTPWTRTSRPA